MKKLLAILMVVSLVILSFASCTSPKTDANEKIKSDIEAVKEPEKVKVQSFDELMKKRTEIGKNIENLSADVNCVIDLDAMGETERVAVDMQIESDIKNTVSHLIVNTTPQSTGETTTSETYSDIGYTYTKDFSNEWFRHTNDLEDRFELKALIEELKNKEIDYSKYVSDALYSEEVYNGKECYKLSYNMNLRLIEMLSELGVKADEINELKEELSEELGPEMATMIFNMFSDLGTVPVTEYIDAYTLYPVAMSADMTPPLQALLDKIIDFAVKAYGEGLTKEDLGLELTINEFSFDMVMDSVNTTEIIIPEEVLAAPEFFKDYMDEDFDYDDYDDYDEDYDDYDSFDFD